jgi:hypothetical protein
MAIVRHQNVLGFQVPVVDPNGMTILHGIQDLEEGVFGKSIISDEVASFGDVGEQVALGTKFNNDKRTVWAI